MNSEGAFWRSVLSGKKRAHSTWCGRGEEPVPPPFSLEWDASVSRARLVPT